MLKILKIMSILCTGLFLAAGASAGERDAALATVEKGCIKGCTPDGKDLDYCKPYCKCASDLIRDKIKSDASTRDTELKKATMACSGKVGIVKFEKDCLSDCGKGANCKKRCSCVKNQLRGMGSDETVGQFLTKLVEDEAGAKAKMDAITAGCDPASH
jgi:hypothetical protein